MKTVVYICARSKLLDVVSQDRNIACSVQDNLFFQNTPQQFLKTQVSNADSFMAAFSACTTACLYLSAAVFSQITESMMAHTNFHMQKKRQNSVSLL